MGKENPLLIQTLWRDVLQERRLSYSSWSILWLINCCSVEACRKPVLRLRWHQLYLASQWFICVRCSSGLVCPLWSPLPQLWAALKSFVFFKQSLSNTQMQTSAPCLFNLIHPQVWLCEVWINEVVLSQRSPWAPGPQPVCLMSDVQSPHESFICVSWGMFCFVGHMKLPTLKSFNGIKFKAHRLLIPDSCLLFHHFWNHAL